jgi:antitoxin component HigA of HigAB toxin-antitoxin module
VTVSLVTLVEAFEAKHYALDLPDAVEAIKHHMDQKGLAPRDLIPFIGSRNLPLPACRSPLSPGRAEG